VCAVHWVALAHVRCPVAHRTWCMMSAQCIPFPVRRKLWEGRHRGYWLAVLQPPHISMDGEREVMERWWQPLSGSPFLFTLLVHPNFLLPNTHPRTTFQRLIRPTFRAHLKD
jgi:hypothetical protein